MTAEKKARSFPHKFLCESSQIQEQSDRFDPEVQTLKHESQMQITFKKQEKGKKQIKSYIPIVKGNQIIKVTEINVHDRIVKIIDTFNAIPYRSLNNSHDSHQKRQPPTKPIKEIIARKSLFDCYEDQSDIYDPRSTLRTRSTKNTPKIIMKLFEKWLEKRSLTGLCPDSQFEKLKIESGTYNNKLVVGISKNSQLRKAFIVFSQNKGSQAIGNSLIHDKQTHLYALKTYEKLCKKEQENASNALNAKNIAENLSFVQHTSQIQSEKDETSKKEENTEYFSNRK